KRPASTRTDSVPAEPLSARPVCRAGTFHWKERTMSFNRSDVGAGALFIAIGLFFGLMTLFELDIGTARRMGPGYFPIALAGILIVLGLAVILKGIGHADPERGNLPWRGLVVLLSVPILFGLLIRPLG